MAEWDAAAARAELVDCGWLTAERYAELAAVATQALQECAEQGYELPAAARDRFMPSFVDLCTSARVPLADYLDAVHGPEHGDAYRQEAGLPPRAPESAGSVERRRMCLAARLIHGELTAAESR